MAIITVHLTKKQCAVNGIPKNVIVQPFWLPFKGYVKQSIRSCVGRPTYFVWSNFPYKLSIYALL